MVLEEEKKCPKNFENKGVEEDVYKSQFEEYKSKAFKEWGYPSSEEERNSLIKSMPNTARYCCHRPKGCRDCQKLKKELKGKLHL